MATLTENEQETLLHNPS